MGDFINYFWDLLTLLGLLASSIIGEANNTVSESVINFHNLRLPSSLKPKEYLIKVFPIRSNAEHFDAFVQIDFEVMERTSVIYLNMADINLNFETLQITSCSWKGKEVLRVIEYTLFPEREIATFALEKILWPGNTLRFLAFYSGSLVNNSLGLNQIYYVEDGIEKRVLATYLQPIGARRVFPCMDEPALKAQFTLYVASSDENVVLSNMEVKQTSRRHNDSYTWIEFQKTPPMSTYLLAFIISNFKTDNTSLSKTKVWSRKCKIKDVAFSSYLAPKVLEWYENYFLLNFPLPKLDLVALPSYTVSGMENLGLITAGENALTTNGKLKRKEWVATVTAHEVAHQWAGNLVTPSWWSEFWLSEGFATYFAARALDEIQPDLEATNHLLTENVWLALLQDFGKGASVLSVLDFDPQVSSIKNLEFYYKGAAILRMLNSVLGEKLFSDGIKKYFNKFQFGSASENDFCTIFAEEGDTSLQGRLPVALDKIMSSWTKQKGYPLLTVTRMNDGKIAVKQELFTPINSSLPEDLLVNTPASNYFPYWWIPLSFSTSKNPTLSNISAETWLHPTNASTVLVSDSQDEEWILLNYQQTLYLRVNYDNTLWNAIATQLRADHTKLPVLNRAQLFEDAFYLFQTGHISLDPALTLMTYLAKEKDYFPLRSALRRFRDIENVMKGNEHYDLLKAFALSFLSPLLRGPFGKNHVEKKRYELLLSWVCKFNGEECIKISQEFFETWKITNDVKVFPELALDSLLCSAIYSGSEEDWNFTFLRFLSMPESKTKQSVMKSLSCSTNQTVIKMYLDYVIKAPHNITADDVQTIVDNLARSNSWNQFIWNYLYKHFDHIIERFGVVLPFVITPNDLFQFARIMTEKSKLPEESFKMILDENKIFADESERTISQCSDWLIRNGPEENGTQLQ